MNIVPHVRKFSAKMRNERARSFVKSGSQDLPRSCGIITVCIKIRQGLCAKCGKPKMNCIQNDRMSKNSPEKTEI